MLPRSGYGGDHSGLGAMKGYYLMRSAVAVMALYFSIQLLSQFAEILLPFMFAVLLLVVLEPLKQFIMRVLMETNVTVARKFGCESCLQKETRREKDDGETEGYMGENLYGHVPSTDSDVGDFGDASRPHAASSVSSTITARTYTVPVASAQKVIHLLSILLCLLLTSRALYVIFMIFYRSAADITNNVAYYQLGRERMTHSMRKYIEDLHWPHLDFEKIMDEALVDLKLGASVVTENVLYSMVQAAITLIFVLYMLWSPIKTENSVVKTIFESMSSYLKVKCLISALSGFSVFLSLYFIGLDLPAAFGILAFFGNFIPNIGAFVVATLPCVLAIIDVRKSTGQVIVGFIVQCAIHLTISNFVEPVFFGASAELHSVIVILGICFFGHIWGVPGMLLSVPLLAIARLLLTAAKSVPSRTAEDRESIAFLEAVLQGKWMADMGDEFDDMDEFGDAPHDRGDNYGSPKEKSPPNEMWSFVEHSSAGQCWRKTRDRHGLKLDLSLLLIIIFFLFSGFGLFNYP